jgi:hypothetical protein
LPFKPKEKAFPKAAKFFRVAAEAEAATLPITCAQKSHQIDLGDSARGHFPGRRMSSKMIE